MSLSFFSGRTLTAVEAGLALNITSSLVKGLMPLWALVGRLADGADLQETGKDELANSIFLHVGFDDVGEGVNHGSHLLAAEFGAFGDLIEDLGFVEFVFDRC